MTQEMLNISCSLMWYDVAAIVVAVFSMFYSREATKPFILFAAAAVINDYSLFAMRSPGFRQDDNYCSNKQSVAEEKKA